MIKTQESGSGEIRQSRSDQSISQTIRSVRKRPFGTDQNRAEQIRPLRIDRKIRERACHGLHRHMDFLQLLCLQHYRYVNEILI
jgi:hypothetical protein